MGGFWKSGHLASFADGWYFAGVSHTTLGYGDVVLPKPWRSLGSISAINGLRVVHRLSSACPGRRIPSPVRHGGATAAAFIGRITAVV